MKTNMNSGVKPEVNINFEFKKCVVHCLKKQFMVHLSLKTISQSVLCRTINSRGILQIC